MDLEVPFPGSDDVIECPPDPDGCGYAVSINRRRPAGTIVWTLEPPLGGGHDVWTSVQFEQGQLVAFSWSCYLVRIDPDTGAELSRVFTK